MPQIRLRPFIARTMVEDRAPVKAGGGGKTTPFARVVAVPPCPAAHREKNGNSEWPRPGAP
jgi:hypothetical protein